MKKIKYFPRYRFLFGEVDFKPRTPSKKLRKALEGLRKHKPKNPKPIGETRIYETGSIKKIYKEEDERAYKDALKEFKGKERVILMKYGQIEDRTWTYSKWSETTLESLEAHFRKVCKDFDRHFIINKEEGCIVASYEEGDTWLDFFDHYIS